MNIDTQIGKGLSGHKVLIAAYSDKRITLTIFKRDGYGCNWCGVSLNPDQAIKVAYRLQNPLPDMWVDFADPEPPELGEMRPTWDVFKVKHSNGVFKAHLAIAKNKLAVQTCQILTGETPAGPTDYFMDEHTESLTPKEITRLAGILYYWAGAHLIGYVTERTIIKEQVLAINLKAKEAEAEDWRDDDSPKSELTFGTRRSA